MKKTKKLSLNKATVSKLDGKAVYGGQTTPYDRPMCFEGPISEGPECDTSACGSNDCPSAGCPTGTCGCATAACPSAACSAGCGTQNCTIDYNCGGQTTPYGRPICIEVPI